jgi:hypothetical protein
VTHANAAAWVEPTPARQPAPGEGVLTPEQIASWRERGFALVDGVLPGELLERVLGEVADAFPAPGSAEAAAVTDFGSLGRMAFPAASEAVNALTLHPRLLGAVGELLGEDTIRLRLSQSDLWPKYGRSRRSGQERDNDDQRIHVDYPNHTLTHPPPWDAPEAVEILVYLSDVEGCGGATAVVPRTGPDDPAYAWPIVDTPGVGDFPWINDRESAEAWLRKEAPEVARFRAEHLYPRELRVRYGVGTLLLYRHDTWHRGTPLRPGALRLAQNLTFRRARSEWISTLQPGWAWAMYRPSRVMERLLARGSVEQRCVLGFPAPGDPYWTRQTLAAVRARFGPLGMDLTPYEAALAR